MIHSIVLLLSVLLGTLVIVVLSTAHLMAQAILRPPRMTDGKAVYVLHRLSPGDLGLSFAHQIIPVRDSANPNGPAIELAAWWIPAAAASAKTVVLIHGYADAKVGSIAWAPTWHALGFNILAFDLRAHGESGGAECTAGFFERHDLNELLDRLRSLRPNETQDLILFGVSMGAAVALATAAMRDDLAAVVIDSPFADYRTAIHRHLDRIGLPTGMIARLAIGFAQISSGANFAKVRPLTLLGQIACPLLLIHGEKEEFLTEAEAHALDEAMAHRLVRRKSRDVDAIWIVPAVSHLGALHADPDLYSRKLDEFLRLNAKSHS